MCGAIKQHDEFYVSQALKCKECVKESVRKNRADKAEYYRSYDKVRFKEDPRVLARHKRYQATPAGKDAIKRAQEKSRAKYPEKKKANIQVNNAVRDGRLYKPDSCSMCGRAKCRIDGHHTDYTKPLDVVWLCRKCHYAEHHKDSK